MTLATNKKYKSLIIKIFSCTLGTLVALAVLLAFVVEIPYIQNLAKDQAVKWLNGKLKTKVSISKLRIHFPNQIVVEKVYFEDQHKDSLLWGNQISVNISLFQLLEKKVTINSVQLDGIVLNIKRSYPDTLFNFDYILHAFEIDKNQVKQKTDTSKSLQFNLGKFDLKNISVRYVDDVIGINTDIYLHAMQTTINDFDIDKSIYGISDLKVDGLHLIIDRYYPLIVLHAPILPANSKSKVSQPEFRMGKFDFTNAQFNYNDAIEGMHGSFDAKQLFFKLGKIDLERLIIPIDQFSMAKSDLIFSIDKINKAKAVIKIINQKIDSSSWHITARNIALDSNNFKFDNYNQAPTKKGIDYQHLYLTGINLQLDSLDVTPFVNQGLLKKMSFNEKAGLQLKELTTRFYYSDQQIRLEQLNLKTKKTFLQQTLILNYPSVSSISTHPENIQIKADFKKSKLAISDILLFAPMLDKNLIGYENSVLSIDAEVHGFVKNLKIPKLELSGLGKTIIKADGLIQGLPNVDHLYADIHITQFSTENKDLISCLPPKTIPDNLVIPDQVNLKGNFKGTSKAFVTKLHAHTSDGDANIDAKIGDHQSFVAIIQLDSANIGKMFKQEKYVGKLTLSAKAKGEGFNYKTMVVDANAAIQSANINNYLYKDALIALNLNQGKATITSSMADPNIKYNLFASAELQNPYPSFKMDLTVDTLNLKQLNLMNEKMAFHGRLYADFKNSNPDSLEGNLMVRNINSTYREKTFSADSIILKASNEKDFQVLDLNSKPFKMYLKGKYKLTELGTALEHTIKEYYKIPGFRDTTFYPQDWKADFLFSASQQVLSFMPELEGTDTIKASIQFKSISNELKINASAPLVQYANYHIKNLEFSAASGKNQLDYHLRVRQAGNPSFIINETSLDGQVKANTIFGDLVFRDKKLQKNYQLAGTFSQTVNGIQLHLDPDSLLLNKQKWVVQKGNMINYDSTGVYAKDFQFQYHNQSIALNSVGNAIGAPLKLDFVQFDINTITDIAKKDSTFADGIVNGAVIFNDATKHPTFTSDIIVTNLAYQKIVLGKLLLKVDNIGENRFNANIELNGRKNQATLIGTYQTNDGLMNLHLLVDSLDVAIIKPFSANQLKEASGNLRAKVDIGGSFNIPSVKGIIIFDSVYMTSQMLGQKFKFDEDAMNFDETGIHFKEFSFADIAGNEAILDGDLFTKNFRDYDFNLKLKAEDFAILNSTQADNQLFFGQLNLNAAVSVSGNLEAPNVNAKLKVNGHTNLTIVMPGTNPELQSREGVVNFIDSKKINDTLTKIVINDSLITHVPFSGLVMNMNIETDTAAIFTMVIDSQTGDAITVKGKSSLVAGLDESGEVSLTGLYEVEKGSYQFSLNMLKKNFEIVKGSTITWTGDPMSAIVNIKALYKLKASTIDLIEQQLVGQAPTEVNKYKQRVPIEVYLIMNGDLMKPEIKFDIMLSDQDISKWPLIDEKLQKLRTDPSEMNKQVFALLILGRFVGEDITQNNTGSTTTGTMVRQSVSSVLSSQLNRVAGGLIKGVDLNFDFQSQDDYSSGTAQTRTDLKVGMSRTLKNDRIKVNVGANVPIEGASSAQNASFISSDVQVDYMLSKDGKYMLRTYSKNNYEGVIEGQIIETGITFIFTVEYDKFKEMFRRAGASKEVKLRKQKEKIKM